MQNFKLICEQLSSEQTDKPNLFLFFLPVKLWKKKISYQLGHTCFCLELKLSNNVRYNHLFSTLASYKYVVCVTPWVPGSSSFRRITSAFADCLRKIANCIITNDGLVTASCKRKGRNAKRYPFCLKCYEHW